MKIRTKNFIYTSSIVVLIVSLAILILYFTMPKYYYHFKENELESLLKTVEERIIKPPQDLLLFTYLDNLKVEKNIIITIRNKNNEYVYPRKQKIENQLMFPMDDEQELNKFNKSLVNQELDEEIIDGKNFIELKKIITDEEGKQFLISLSYSLQPIDDTKFVLLKIYPWILGISFLIGGIFTYLYSYFSTKRIKSISANTKQMTKLQNARLNKEYGKDELAELAHNINFLYLNLVRTIDDLNKELELTSKMQIQKSDFLRAASHELKTPITAMLGVVEGMIHNIGDFNDRDKYLKKCHDILNEQTQLVNEILDISKLDINNENRAENAFEIKEVLEEILPTYQLIAKNKKQMITYSSDNSNAFGDHSEFKRIIRNIISNAVQYTPEKGYISITISSSRVVISNECTPLNEYHLSKVFEAFYRPDFARNRNDGGTGLGLYIVAQLMKRNGWIYSFNESSKIEGMEFIIDMTRVTKNL
ncbi:sensor histidine kinase [Bacillus sp. 1P06AnD]|uniref:sensor histidine kinase n=1 Tax=Bacillus sp. 1P06AnD TaxID=3132208 RepID=UPI0039A266A3